MKILDSFDQLSEEWFRVKTGRISMSHAKELLTGGKGLTRASYLRKVASEILGEMERNGYQSWDMVRGMELEPYAVRAYEALTGAKVQKVGFVLHDDERIGCSPDGLTDAAGLEIKAPIPEHHLRYLDADIVAKEHGPQVQGGLWICEREIWDVISFCPWVRDMPVIRHRFYRDDKVICDLEKSAIRGADEVAEMVEKVRSAAQNVRGVSDIADEAIHYFEMLSNGENGEVRL